MFKNIKLPSRKILIIIGIVLLIIAGGVGYLVLSRSSKRSVTKTQTYSTSVVRKGDISISASGTGTLTAVRQAKLSFSIDGTVETISVKVGEKVKKGQELAKLQNLSSLSSEVTSTKLDLLTAQEELQSLKDNADATLGTAQLAVTTDQKALDDAIAGEIKKGQLRCDQETTSAYYDKYMRLQTALDDLGEAPTDGNYYLTVIVPAKDAALTAYSTYKYCAEYKDYEVDASEADLNLAKAQLKIDQTKLDVLKENKGIDPVDLAAAENKVAIAQSAFEVAEDNLEHATLVAPFDGTILTIAGLEGDRVEYDMVFMTVADDTHPQVEFVMDESDLQKIAVDEAAEVTFDAIENMTFTGTVVQVNPSLVSTGGYQTVQGLVQLNMDEISDPPVLFQGLTASVTLYQGKSEDTLLIPIAALRDIGDGTYGVFTKERDGTLKLNTVTVGLKDTTSAEILSGLKVGDIVTTGLTEAS
jgi:HlyD family secretion protein